jgi:MFS family permease
LDYTVALSIPKSREAALPGSRPSLLRHPDFLKLWAGQTVSVFGSLVSRTAIPFAAILTLGARPFEMGLLGASDALAGLVLGLTAGVWVDRVNRRPILIATDLARALLLFSIPVAAIAGRLTMVQLFAVAMLAGACTVFFDVADQSFLPTLISEDRLVEGNAKLAASASVAEVVAFGGGGWLVQVLTAPIAILLDAVSFVISALLIAFIRTPEPTRPVRAPGEDRRITRELIEGLHALRDRPEIRDLVGAATLVELSYGIGGAVFMLFVTRTLGFRPGSLGLIFAVGGLSSLAGAMLARGAARGWGARNVMIIGLLVSGAAALLAPLCRGAGMGAAGLLITQQLIGDGAVAMFMIHQISRRQTITPDHLRGRVNGCARVLGLAAMLAGSVGAGFLAERVGLRPLLVLAAIARASAALWLVRPGSRGDAERVVIEAC